MPREALIRRHLPKTKAFSFFDDPFIQSLHTPGSSERSCGSYQEQKFGWRRPVEEYLGTLQTHSILLIRIVIVLKFECNCTFKPCLLVF